MLNASGRTDPIRVLFDQQITATQRYGGVSRYVIALLREFGSMTGVAATLVAPAHVNGYIVRGDALHPLSFRLDRLQRGMRYRGLLTEPLFRLASFTSRPDLIHETGFMRQAAGRRRGPKIVTTLHDMILERYPSLFGAAAPLIEAKRQALQRADAIICISENTRRDLLTLYPDQHAKASVVWHGVDATPTAASRLPALARPYLLFVGNRSGYKNFRRLVLAFGASRQLADHYQLVCFGGDPLEAHEFQLIADAGLRPDQVLRIEGDDAAMASAYRHAHLFVFPSEYEGFGMPLTEAMVQGCPIACSKASSFPEVAGDAAEYFDPLDIDSIREALERLAEDGARRECLAALARQRVTLFSWQQCARQTLEVYRSTLAGAHPTQPKNLALDA